MREYVVRFLTPILVELPGGHAGARGCHTHYRRRGRRRRRKAAGRKAVERKAAGRKVAAEFQTPILVGLPIGLLVPEVVTLTWLHALEFANSFIQHIEGWLLCFQIGVLCSGPSAEVM
ncbi:hypothetical protein BDV95DRAFT_598327 [Massariosphaeria phaeospora]|uniref:Uncharacterized protein n=1 Tax=Massariosphaeria phaeospora TaxID=100035 RepID=A0A7C8I0B9_9PLEO|nr:hypothetical protein BDV95DRAFT_598327 [Massariosphaeria phaeospora]